MTGTGLETTTTQPFGQTDPTGLKPRTTQTSDIVPVSSKELLDI